MARERSEEEIKAAEVLEEAMLSWLRAGGGAKDGVVTDYTIVIEQMTYDSDGDPEYTLKWRGKPKQPIHRTIGLVESALIRMKARVSGTLDVVERLR